MPRYLCLYLCLGVFASLAQGQAFGAEGQAAGQMDQVERCVLNTVATGASDTTLREVRDTCRDLQNGAKVPARIINEKLTENSAFVITPHRQNYLLPVTHNAKPNQTPWIEQNVFPGIERPIEHAESKLQISFKVPLWYQDLFFANDGVYFGFTMKSYWQVFNEPLSKPFRETNYRPEVFYQTPIPVSAWDGAFFTRVGFEHESNGRSQLLSRSWNRIFVGVGFLRERWALYIQPWYRIPEERKEDDGDPNTPPPPDGDDNPDIDDYLGHYEFVAVYNDERYEYSSLVRYSFETGKGGLELSASFPLWGRLKGFVQYYQGYGETLIDYNHDVQRIGLGFLLTDLL